MEKTESVNEQTSGVSRRALLKTATAAAVGLALDPLARAQPPATPTEYGTAGADAGQTELNEKTIFPLLAAWLLLTTNGDNAYSVTKGAMKCIAHVGPNTADAIIAAFNKCPDSFNDVRNAFGSLAMSFVPPSGSLYSGGQCPEHVETLSLVATLLGSATPTPSCNPTPGKNAAPIPCSGASPALNKHSKPPKK